LSVVAPVKLFAPPNVSVALGVKLTLALYTQAGWSVSEGSA